MTAATGRRQDWAKVGAFVTARCERAKHSSDWMSELTLYHHYRRWAYFRELSSVSAATFRERLDKKHGDIVIEINGHRCSSISQASSRHLR